MSILLAVDILSGACTEAPKPDSLVESFRINRYATELLVEESGYAEYAVNILISLQNGAIPACVVLNIPQAETLLSKQLGVRLADSKGKTLTRFRRFANFSLDDSILTVNLARVSSEPVFSIAPVAFVELDLKLFMHRPIGRFVWPALPYLLDNSSYTALKLSFDTESVLVVNTPCSVTRLRDGVRGYSFFVWEYGTDARSITCNNSGRIFPVAVSFRLPAEDD